MIKNYPSDELSEMTVLGIAMLDAKEASTVVVSLTEDDFYAANLKNRKVFHAMRLLYDAGKAIDITTVTTQLMDLKELESIGGVNYLIEITDKVTNFTNVEFYITNLKDKSILRNLLMEIDKIESDYESKKIEDVNGFIAECELRINKITNRRRVSDFISAKEAARTIGDKIQRSYGIEGSITGIATGFSNLDALINGLNKSELIILAARPSVGKSAFALNIGYNAASRTRRPVAIFSLEMSVDMIFKRLFASQSCISYDNIQKGILTKEERLKLKEVENDLVEVPLYVDDSSGASIDDIVLKSRKLKENKDGLGLIIVDYIGLINDNKNIYKDNEQAKIAAFSRRLKTLAMELECPVLCLSQLNRQTEARDNKKPQLSDLRSSGAIEQDADKVMFLYRPSYYSDQGISLNAQKKKFGQQNNESSNEEPKAEETRTSANDFVEIMVAKNRSGKIGTTQVLFMKNYGRFFTPDKSHEASFNSIKNKYESIDEDD